MATTSEDRPAGCWGLGVHAARDDAISFARRSGRRKRRSAPPSVARESPLGERREPARMRAPRERVARREPTGVGLRWSASNVAGGEAGRGRIPTARCRRDLCLSLAVDRRPRTSCSRRRIRRRQKSPTRGGPVRHTFVQRFHGWSDYASRFLHALILFTLPPRRLARSSSSRRRKPQVVNFLRVLRQVVVLPHLLDPDLMSRHLRMCLSASLAFPSSR